MNERAFIVSPNGDCTISERELRLRRVQDDMIKREAELLAAGERFKQKVRQVRLFDLIPCPENDEVYGPQSLNDPDILSLIASIKARGITDPIRIGTDYVIISGHRRRFCATHAGLLEAPVIVESISYKDNREEFMRLLVEANEQRKKSVGVMSREAAMKINPADAVQAMRTERKEAEEELLYGTGRNRYESSCGPDRKLISDGKEEFLQAALDVANAHRDYWPLSVRQIHYRLLNDPPMKFTLKSGEAAKGDRRYANNKASYDNLVDLLARARVEGRFPWDAIADETRPEALHNHHWNPQVFFKSQFDRLLKGYRRNRQQSQPNHIEIVAEKLTVRSILDPIASEHSIPLSISRGHNGPTMKKKIVDRFYASKKEKLILLVVTDLDPAGEAIVQNFADDLVDDFGLDDDTVVVIRAGINMGRVEELDLTPSYDTNDKDISKKQKDAFAAQYGPHAYELEAMEPAALQEALTEDINRVLDIDAYNAEVDMEDEDAVAIQARRAMVAEFLRTIPD